MDLKEQRIEVENWRVSYRSEAKQYRLEIIYINLAKPNRNKTKYCLGCRSELYRSTSGIRR